MRGQRGGASPTSSPVPGVLVRLDSPAHLAGQGTSAGGIMIGGVIVRRPDLFGATVIRVGMVNALRFEQIPIGPFNTSKFGTVK
ncbi:prolyl oligopeptidase family serine peptidase [Polyangium sorediatum]|uniref:Prolyl oligopeptidase family serine peptidase n=1 Tax=Polyangium sorediatum TaxID=889274 RepID=A0ABT6P104_9BACT|nr:prolyl oligopeptidase family serine peptidase [Polyangium sorediatum]MDI1433940.1 prolyl oligopeptidase family serine peptidase [Polyangium sorediatum]